MVLLPTELWALVFKFVDPALLPRLSQVCSLWRTLAFCHPAFWEDISIHVLSRSTIGWTSLRLEAARPRPCDLLVTIEGTNPLLAPLLYIIDRELHHLRSLIITLDVSCFSGLCDVIVKPAPCLETFCLTLLGDGLRPEIAIPPNIFAGVSGKLNRVELYGVQWPNDVVPAFADVELATLSYPRSVIAPFPAQIPSLFPRLRSLSLASGILALTSPLDDGLLSHVAGLNYLDLDLGTDGYASFLHNVPTAQIADMVLTSPDPGSLASVVGSLPGALTLDFTREISNDGYVGLLTVVQSTISAQRRWIGEFSGHPPGSYHALTLLHNPQFAMRVQELCVGSAVWADAAPYITRCSAVSRIIVFLETDAPTTRLPPEKDVSFPALRSLRLQAERCHVAVQPSNLTTFAESMSPRLLHLELDGVSIVGGCTQLKDQFSSITVIGTPTRSIELPVRCT